MQMHLLAFYFELVSLLRTPVFFYLIVVVPVKWNLGLLSI